MAERSSFLIIFTLWCSSCNKSNCSHETKVFSPKCVLLIPQLALFLDVLVPLTPRDCVLSPRQVIQSCIFICSHITYGRSRVNQVRTLQVVCLDFASLFCHSIEELKYQIYKDLHCCTCMLCGKRNLELLSSLTLKAFLTAFHRFISRRGYDVSHS